MGEFIGIIKGWSNASKIGQVQKDNENRKYPFSACPPTMEFINGERVTFDIGDPSQGNGQEIAHNVQKVS